MNEFKNENPPKFFAIWQKFMQKPASLWLLIATIGLGLLLLLNGSGSNNVSPDPAATQLRIAEQSNSDCDSAEAHLEAELTKTIEAIVGTGRARVDVNLRTGGRKVWERQTRTNKRVVQETAGLNTEENNDDEMVFAKDRDGRDSPILKEELAPEIQGVVIVIAGVEDIRIKKTLTDTVMTILGLPAHRVMIINGRMQRGVVK